MRTIRASVPTPRVADRHVDELAASRLAGAVTAADSIRIRNSITQAERVERFPVASLIRSDSRGRLWVRPFLWRMEREAAWVVLEPSGAVLGRITLPSSLEVYDIGDDYILGAERDEDGVQSVAMFRYRRP